MPKKTTIGNLTSRDMDVLEILWNDGSSMTVSQIVASGDPDLTVNTVNAIVRKLLKMELIEVAEIVYNNTSLCRSFRPTQTAKDTVLSFFAKEFDRFHSQLSTSSLVAALLDTETDQQRIEEEIRDLELYLADYRKSLKK